MRKLLLILACSIVILSVLGNYLYYQSKQLPQPIMLKHYYEIASEENMMFDLHYITNKNEKNDIQSITIPGMGNYPFYQDVGRCENYGHYCLKTISVKINEMDIKEKAKNGFRFDKVRAYLTNGEVVTYPIGEISIVKDSAAKLPIDFIVSSSSTDHTGEQMLKAKEPLSIQTFQIPFRNQLKDGVQLSIITDQGTLAKVYNEMTSGHFDDQKISNWKQGKVHLVEKGMFPLILQKEDLLNTSYQFTFGDGDNRFHFYQFGIKIKGKTKKGKEFTAPLLISYSPSFSYNGITEMVKQRGEINDGTRNK